MTGDLDLNELADRMAIRRLVDDYARAADRVDGPAAGACFAPDGMLRLFERGSDEPLRVRTGPEDIATAFGGLSIYDVTLHIVANHYVELDGDTGTGETYCLAHHIHDADDGSGKLDYVMAIRYLDQYRRTPDGWRFSRRDNHLQFAEDRPVVGP